jgi:fibronectin type 3 domain-containing protein
VTGYRIYRSSSGGQWTPLATIGNVLSFVDTTVSPGATFSYSVSAMSAYGEGPRSTTVVAQRALPPAAPTNLAASVVKTGIALSWTAPANGGSSITGYRIYRGTATGGESFLVSVGAGTTTFTDAGVTHKVRYFYRVTAVNVIGEGPVSTEVSAIAR